MSDKIVTVTIKIPARVPSDAKSGLRVLVDLYKNLAEDVFRATGATIETTVEEA